VNKIIPEDEPENEEPDKCEEFEIKEDGIIEALESPRLEDDPDN
jgi:hypothetical protein